MSWFELVFFKFRVNYGVVYVLGNYDFCLKDEIGICKWFKKVGFVVFNGCW